MIANNVSRAYFHAAMEEDENIELPQGDNGPCRDIVGDMKKAMYGARSAALAWQKEVIKRMGEMGFKSLRSSPCVLTTGKRFEAHGARR